MKRFLRFCSMILTVVMVLNMLPLQSLAVTVQENITASDTVTSKPSAEEETIVGEIVSARSEYSKEYLLSNGLHMAKVYSEPVHYEKDGSWEEIDNTLKRTTSGTYSNTAGLWNVQFPQKMGANAPVTITKDGYTLSFAMAGELRQSGDLEVMSGGLETADLTAVSPGEETYTVNAAQTSAAQIQQVDLTALREATNFPETVTGKQYSQLLYPNVYAGTNIRYDLDSTRVKESIILSSYSSTLRGYRYTLNTGGLVPVLAEDGQIDFYDAGRENIVMTMPAPFLVDEAMEYSYDVQVQLTGSGSTYTLTYLLPRSWLASADRQWPVVLDPVVEASTLKVNIEDITVSEGKTYSRTWGMLQCGYSTTYGLSRFYVKFKNLPQLTSSDVILKADVWLYKHASGSTMQIEAYKVLGTWSDTSMTWSTQPACGTVVEDYTTTTGIYNYGWELTDLVRSWYDEGNNGVMFKVPDHYEDVNYNTYRQFRSVDYGYNRPTLEIKFRNNNGLEDFWDYTSHSAGRAGTGHINNLTGNLTWIRDDMGFGGNLMPVSIQHIYNANDCITPDDGNNSNDSGGNFFGMGVGWRTNYNQRVFHWETDPAPDIDYYVWEDGDGTDHYFYYVSSGKYQDEDNADLTLTTTGSGNEKYVLTEKNVSTSYFDVDGRLTKIENIQKTKSSVDIEYSATDSWHIEKVTDGAGREYDYVYENGLLARIKYHVGDGEYYEVNYVYDTSNNLYRVIDPDTKISQYEYNTAHILTKAIDIDGYRLEYTYNDAVEHMPYRVELVEEKFNGTPGGKLEIEYSAYQTTFKDVSGNKQIIQFDIEGNAVAVHDDEGRAQVMQFGNQGQSGAGKGHQLTLSSKLQNSVSNWFTNSSFESNSNWSALGSTVSSTNITGTAYRGSHSLKVTSQANGTASGVYSSAVNVGKDKTYTFSAYVKTGEGRVWLEINDGNTSKPSEILEKNSDWSRLQVTYENKSGSAKQVTLRLMTAEVGTSYIDCIQTEEAPTASRYNLCENGNFEAGMTSWVGSACTTVDTVVDINSAVLGEVANKAFRIIGNHTSQKQLSQKVYVSGEKNDCYVFAGWAKGDATPRTSTRRFALQASFHYTDGTTADPFIFHFNPDTDDGHSWQYGALALVAKGKYDYITLQLLYDYNVNTVYFDDIQLYKEEFGTSYAYNEDGTVKSVVDLQKQTTNYQYENGNLTSITQDNKAKMTYEYDNWHNVTKATSEEGIVYEFTYDDWGNNETVSVVNGSNRITTKAAYSDDKNRLASTTDALGKETTYGYNEYTNMLDWVEYPNNTETTRTTYDYDSMYRRVLSQLDPDGSASTAKILNGRYTYTNDLLTKIQTGSTTYNFNYGDFALLDSIQIGVKNEEEDNEEDLWTLAEYYYTDDGNNYLERLDYGNNDRVEYEYDQKGRETKVTYTNSDGSIDTVTFEYDNTGALATATDSATGIKTTFYYDFTDRLMKYVESGTNYNHSVGYDYDLKNNLTESVEIINGTAYTTGYDYDDDNRLEYVNFGSAKRQYLYDNYGRTHEQITKNGDAIIKTDKYGFTVPTGDGVTSATSTQIASHTIDAAVDTTYNYTYDANGNILTISWVSPDDGKTYTTSYVYDAANQLLRENNQAGGFTHVWTYDNAGNITSRTEYDYTTGTLNNITSTASVEYKYEDPRGWKDLLTQYGTQVFDYDDVGNLEDDGTWTYTWKHGRQLASMTSKSNPATEWEFTYNADGVRTKRSDGTDTYSYIYNGSSLTHMTVGNNTLHFSYDASGTPLTVTYNGTVYYYTTDIHGSVIAILNSSGTAVVNYTYDAWGNPCGTNPISGTLATTLGTDNPLRYRGYVYDQETGLYYLQSRYYDPEIGRFINADDASIIADGCELLIGYNLFAYCLNNPVNMSDGAGTWPSWATKVLIGTAVIAAAAILTVATAGTGTALACFAVGALKGAAVGAAIGAATGAATGAVTHRVTTGSWEGAGQAALEGAADGYMSGAITGFISGGMTSNACFVAGTSVLSAAGAVAIETIQAGDLVWAWDEEIGDVALKEVVETYVNETNELIHVFVNGEEIITTPTHPFYSPVKGWMDAVRLRAGDILVLVNGEYVVVEKVQHEILEAPIAVYNFHVEDYHTYYVTDVGVLVHNLCNATSKIKQSNSLVKEAKKLTGKVQQEADNLVYMFRNGNANPGIGTKHLSSNIYYLRGRSGSRIFYRMIDGTMEILGKATKGNEDKVIELVLKTFG